MIDEKARADLVARLEEDLKRLEADIAEFDATQRDSLSEASGENEYRDHMADQGSATFERELDMTLEENERNTLEQVRAAIERVKTGTYGTCSRCGADIPVARLNAMPTATLCIACKEAEESPR
ncbi:MAG TPA: TraR/DksA C4-type zinc finger protein [Coriobacteriia bacterium]